MRQLVLIITALAVVSVAPFSFAAGEISWKTYTDKKLGFSSDYPDLPDVFNDSREYVDDEGVSHFDQHSSTPGVDGRYALDIYGRVNSDGSTGASLLRKWTDMDEDQFGYVNGVVALEGTAKADDGHFTLDYADDSAGPGLVKHVYGLVTPKTVIVYELRYPVSEAQKYKEIASHIEGSLKAPE
jgi:hypothetical protein